MYYKIALGNGETEVISTNYDFAKFRSLELFLLNRKTVGVELYRRKSEFSGDWQKVVSYSPVDKKDIIDSIEYKKPITPKENKILESLERLHPLTEYRLENEHRRLRRIIELCRSKKKMLNISKERNMYNEAIEKELAFISQAGWTKEDVAILAERYECTFELMFK